ncbi:MAG TPA: DUF4167 domain-containing protein [Caulobacteraceae bacterium]|nr:DUF4167 domain-containing protein [Caulobacteraceae bacterium]
MKRQRNRGRGGGGGGNSGGGGKPQHNANRAFDSNGPDGVKVRGAAQHIFERYQQLARDAGSGGDRVLAENYLQHAEHYFRLLRTMQPQRSVGEILGRDQFVSGYDLDFEEEPREDGTEAGEADGDAADGRREDRPWARDDRQRDNPRDAREPRDDRPQGEWRPREEYRQQGGYRQQNDARPRDDRGPREERQPGEARAREERDQGDFRQKDDRFRDDRRERFGRDERQARFRDDRRPERDARPDRDPLGVVEPQAAAPLTPAPAAAYEASREQPRAGMLRGEDGAVSQAPAFLQSRVAEPRSETEEPAEARRPRRRRAPRAFEASPTAAPAEADEG